jgi:phenylpropionate dioxygenase-like ring-hydroxylating dioxygenase large terminal subunit
MDGDRVLRLGHRLAELNRQKRFDSVDHSVEADTGRYIDPDRWQREKDRIFRREPQLIGLGADIPEPGDYWAFDFAGMPVVIVRGPDRVARAFVNACRHRGTAFAYGRGKGADRFLCPYHHWCYDLKGRLTGLPERAAFADCDLETRNLIALPLAEKYGLLVLSPSPDREADVDRFLGPAAPEITPFGFDGVTFVKSRTEEIPINWKLMNEAGMEGYHVTALHGPSLAKINGVEQTLRHFTYDRFGRHGRICAGKRALLDMDSALSSAEEALRFITLTNYLYPSSYLVFGATNVTFQRSEPGSAPNKSVLTLTSYSWKPPATDGIRVHQEYMFDAIWDIGVGEDVWAMGSAQKAFDAGYPSTVLYGGVEPGVQNVNAQWDEALAAN